jgi:hypothetical protein
MNLHPILPHSTRQNYKLGLLSLTKYNLSLVMDFLDPQAILPFSRANKYFVAPTSPTPPPPQFFSSPAPTTIVFVTQLIVGPSPLLLFLALSSSPFGCLHAGPSLVFDFSVWGLDMLSSFFFLVVHHDQHFHVALTDAEKSRRATGNKGNGEGAAPSLLPSLPSLSLFLPSPTNTCLGLLTCGCHLPSSSFFNPLLRLDVCTRFAVCLRVCVSLL